MQNRKIITAKAGAGWRDYLIALLIVFGLLFGLFQLRILLGSLQILGHFLAVGAAAGLLLSVLLIFLKKPAILAVAAALFLLAWFVVPDESPVSSVMWASGCLCCIASVPFLASLLACLPKRFSERV